MSGENLTRVDCFACSKHAQGSEVPGGIIYEDHLVYVGHILPPNLTDVYLGYVIVEPRRHVGGLGELTDDEARALGSMVSRAARALKITEGAEHVYSWVLGDAVPHLHIHLVPRYPGTPKEYRGFRVVEWPDAKRGGVNDMGAVCDRLRHALPAL